MFPTPMKPSARETRRALHIEIVSDLISPWCYISRRRLHRALGRIAGSLSPDVTWTPYEINPEMPAGGMALEAYLTGLFGSTEAAQPLLKALSEAGRGEGIEFRFDRIPVVPNTLDAHRLVLLGEREGRSDEVVEQVFKAFFEEGRDIGDRRTLVEIGESAGLAPSWTAAELEGDASRQEVQSRQARIRNAGLTGVPGLIVNGTVAVLGAQEPDTIVAAIDQALFPALQGDDGPVTVH